MANPTTYVADALFSDWTKVDPVRYGDGLWLEEATTNYHLNPYARNNTFGYLAQGSGAAIAHVTGDPDFGTGVQVTAGLGTTGMRAYRTSMATASGDIASCGISIKGTGNVRVNIQVDYTDASNDVGSTTATIPLSSSPQRIIPPSVQTDIGKTLATINVWVLQFGAGALDAVVSLPQIELKPYPTSLCPEINQGDGSANAGYAFTGTAHASPSTRAASSASISPSGIIDTYLGAIVFRATPTVETGAEEIWGELGEKGAGTDHIRWGRDATKHPYVEWSGNDSAYTRITLTPTVDAGDEHFYSIEWHVGDADFRLYLDDNPSDNDTIPSPQEDYGAGPLKLQATAGGVIYNGLMICNARLTDAQRARLQEVDHWSVRTLERLRVGVARPQFELRPY